MKPTCASPMPNANLASARSRSMLSSSPISKSRNKIPNSANRSISSTLRNHPKWFKTTPAPKNPITGLTLIDLNAGMIMTVAARKVSVSKPRLLITSMVWAQVTTPFLG